MGGKEVQSMQYIQSACRSHVFPPHISRSWEGRFIDFSGGCGSLCSLLHHIPHTLVLHFLLPPIISPPTQKRVFF